MIDVTFFILLFAFVTFMYQWRDTTEYGSQIARQLLPQNLLVGLAYALALNLRGLFTALLFTIFFLGAWILWLKHMLRQPAAGQILLRWKRTKQTGEIMAVVVCVLLGIFLMVFGLTRDPVRVENIYVGLLFIMLVPTLVFDKEACLTENGIETGRDYIRWEQIESYRWSKYDKSVTHLFFKTSRRLPIINFVQLNLPLDKKETVNEIVLQKMQQIPAIPEKTSLTS